MGGEGRGEGRGGITSEPREAGTGKQGHLSRVCALGAAKGNLGISPLLSRPNGALTHSMRKDTGGGERAAIYRRAICIRTSTDGQGWSARVASNSGLRDGQGRRGTTPGGAKQMGAALRYRRSRVDRTNFCRDFFSLMTHVFTACPSTFATHS